MTKSELLNNVFFENAKGDFPIIYITSDDDVVKVGGIINAPMVGRIYFSEVKKTITKDELLANKEFICASEDSEILIDFGGYRRETLDCYVTVDDSCINIIELLGRTITILIKCRRSSQTLSIGLGKFIPGRRRSHTRLRMMLGSF
jgi:hypothetical protein